MPIPEGRSQMSQKSLASKKRRIRSDVSQPEMDNASSIKHGSVDLNGQLDEPGMKRHAS